MAARPGRCINVRGLAIPEFKDRTAEPVVYEGETPEARIARRKQKWTPTEIVWQMTRRLGQAKRRPNTCVDNRMLGHRAMLDPTYAEETEMPTEILMPALSPTMEEGKLAKWLVKEGQTVKAGDIIAEIETDKATMEVEAVDEGKVGKLLVAEGTEGVKVNTPIATLLAEGESAGAASGDNGAAAIERSPTQRQLPPPGGRVREGGIAEHLPSGSPHPCPSPQGGGEARVATSALPTDASPATAMARIFASPLARRLAKEAGLDLAALTGSGPHGRIVKRDVETAVQNGGARAQARAGTAVTAKPQRTAC